jgi:hypothetical protein
MAEKVESQDPKQIADDARLEQALQTIKDVLWRFEDNCDGRRGVYEIIGCLVEDLILEGVCAACIEETVNSVFDATGVDTVTHKGDQDSIYH